LDRKKYFIRQIERVNKQLTRLDLISRKYSWSRLIISGIAGIFVLLALFFTNSALSWIAFILFFIAFIILAFIHGRIKRKIVLFYLFRSIKQGHINRMELNWSEIPMKIGSAPSGHPFANDLNITGEISLYRLLNNTVTAEGANYLLKWLLNENHGLTDTLNRQHLIRDLRPLFLFRDKLSFYASGIGKEEFNGKKLLTWLKRDEHAAIPSWLLITLFFLAGINIILFFAYNFQLIPAYFTISLFLYIGLFLSSSKYIKNLFTDAVDLADEFNKINKILLLIEKYKFRSKYLTKLCEPVKVHPPSNNLRKMNILLSFIGLRANPLIQIFVNLIFPVDYLLNHLLTAHKKTLIKQLPHWLETWHQLDALSAMANFAYIFPDYIFPKIEEKNIDNPEILFKTEDISHPLIPTNIRIANNFVLSKNQEITLITGSNMSGKSTFLRTIGINLVLAYAGGPVSAKELTVILLKIFTCINIQDSLGDGISYFYAEVKRLKQILDQSDQVFFLIDEIYRGTNNRERLIGSKAIIKTLSERNNPGIISTHDLELTTMETEIPNLINYHFRDKVTKGKMTFDYKLHNGPCPTTNALKIMSLEGLPIE